MPGSPPNIIIIGAGAAGIAAATRLLEHGISDLTILEAENRIGGRINSVEFDGTVVDLGGQWCHGEVGNIVYDLVKDLNLLSPSHNNYQDNTYYSSNGQVVNKSLTDRLCNIAFGIINDATAVETDSHRPFGEYFIQQYNELVAKDFGDNQEALKISSLLVDWFHKFFICLDSAKNWNDISVRGAHTFEVCDGDLQLNWKRAGYRTILDVLMKKIPDATKQLPIDGKIFLNKEVTKIVWDHNNVNNGGVTVDCADGSLYNADHAIVTVSLGVLKNIHKTVFVPELPTFKQNVIEGMSIGTVNKILLKFPTKWWSDDVKGFSLVWSEDDKKSILNQFGPSINGKSWLEDIFGFYVIDSHPKILMAFVVGEMAADVELLSDEVVRDGCMFLLRKFVGNKYDVPLPDGILRTKWGTNPHFCGSYVHCSINAEKSEAYAVDLAKPLVSSNSKQILLFAGEGTHSTSFSTVHGAIETGHREADRIINIYKNPQSKDCKIAIMGAGMAGLGAARALLDLGHTDIIILEAQNKAGGRIRTISWEGGVLELGAQWIHGTLNPLYRLAEEHNLLSREMSREGLGLYVRDNGDIIDNDVVQRVDFEIGKILEECERFVDESTQYPQSVGDFMADRFMEYLDKSDDSDDVKEIKRELLDWHVRFQVIDNSCLDLKELSAKEWGRYVCVDGQAHINLKHGYQSLIDVLVDGLPKDMLFLSSAVVQIKYDNGDINIECQNGLRVRCQHLIVTASLGVLKELSSTISPPLPAALTQSISDMGFHGIGKIYLIFDQKWWSFEGVQFVWRASTTLNTDESWVRDITGFDSVLNQSNVLLGWVGGKGVNVMESMSEEMVGVHCMRLMRRFISSREIPDPVKVIRTRWCSNPWIRGGYSHTSTACDRSGAGIRNLGEAVRGGDSPRILLAGEAVHPSHFSTTHGAYESGQQQAGVLHEYLTRIAAPDIAIKQ